MVLPLMLLALAAAPTTQPSLNEQVLAAARSYRDGGGYNLKWGGSGTCEEIRFNDQRILPKGTQGTYCSGFTFTVMMNVAQRRGLLEGKSVDQVKRLQKEWYGAVADKEIAEKQCGVALQRLGIGRTIDPDDAQPGDFCQLWRTTSGHSVVFLGWVEKDGKRIGLKYRSSQEGTNGIGDRVEHFRDSGKKGEVDRNRIYFGRLGA